MEKKFSKTEYSREGFVLLFAVLISSIVLAVGTGIFNIALKEVILSRASRDSQFAFFAADTGAECAFFWDRKYFLVDPTLLSAFPINDSDPLIATPPGGVKCSITNIVTGVRDGETEGVPWVTDPKGATFATTQFTLTFSDGSCAEVSVEKNLVGGVVKTKMTSVGLSICSETDPNVVRRTIVAEY